MGYSLILLSSFSYHLLKTQIYFLAFLNLLRIFYPTSAKNSLL
ncbi:Hypothetical protein HPV225_0974 [Helicobacter pylori v225d]|nr:Hypothetical protein HPV225_0974 [Helicobacter pylori v225d]